ncbi:DUF47 domain-containing protein [Trueperella pecoris]|uniref:DUF47 family protein n=1 Tax=Trueperella pecoris TaxID=2733571 RepID=A0A7M1QVS9_9ACTO|nr:DUF47 family protein [Trueperella pecoris]QOQ39457.1 DUF47 family protein [Trueperella pecoris]QOR45921.1 DUF47 family protein [Trueperella pecoris]QTG75751.1 DUF47 family protein [Trueperella pecoris]
MAGFFGRFNGQHAVQGLLNEQATHLVRSAKVLADMVSADSAARADLNVKLHDIENQADTASHMVLKEVGTRFILPYDRGDLIQLTGQIDTCVDMIDEAGNNLVLYRIGEVPSRLFEMTDIIIQCAEHAVTAIGKLKKIEPSIRTEWLEINNLENRADQIYRELIIDLFASERSGKDILARKITLDSYEAAVDSFETLASGIELLTLKES